MSMKYFTDLYNVRQITVHIKVMLITKTYLSKHPVYIPAMTLSWT